MKNSKSKQRKRVKGILVWSWNKPKKIEPPRKEQLKILELKIPETTPPSVNRSLLFGKFTSKDLKNKKIRV